MLEKVEKNNERIVSASTQADLRKGTRVCCLYRVSTDKQVDHVDNEADIPMQRKSCREFARSKGWTIVEEVQEAGVSGHKVRASDRDQLQHIRQMALEDKFDILLVFLFDRLGRISDETPFVLEWFIRQGIQVWSTQEGEQRIDNHTDRLLNYIRFWQADGESQKTSIRTKTAIRQMVQEGSWRGGTVPYGYEMIATGEKNKRKQEIHALKIKPSEAVVVRMMYDWYTTEGCGAQHITTMLNEKGLRARSGKPWHPATVHHILQNKTYTGVFRCGDVESPPQEDLQIISAEQFRRAMEIREQRMMDESERTIPQQTDGPNLLSGNIYCAHCGSRLMNSRAVRKYSTAKDPEKKYVRDRYICYGKVRHQVECPGQTTYTAKKIDEAVEGIALKIFRQVGGIQASELLELCYGQKMSDMETNVKYARKAWEEAAADSERLKREILKALRGESAFPPDILNELIAEAKEKEELLKAEYEKLNDSVKDSRQVYARLEKSRAELISWGEMYSNATRATKKMVMSMLFQRISVGRGYKIVATLRPEFADIAEVL